MTGLLRPPIAGVFGGGGLFGIGYALGVIDGLRVNGTTFDGAPMLGTSAGSWAAAAVATGADTQHMLSMPTPRFPNPTRGFLAGVAREFFGESRSDLVTTSACALPRLRRRIFSGSEHALADLVAASSAVPGLLAPHTIDGVQYVDGGMRSGTSVDLGPDAESLVVIAPLAGAMWGPFRRLIDSGMNREIARWKERNDAPVTLFTPVDAAAHIAQNPKHLFDRSRALEAYYCGFEQADTDGIRL